MKFNDIMGSAIKSITAYVLQNAFRITEHLYLDRTSVSFGDRLWSFPARLGRLSDFTEINLNIVS